MFACESTFSSRWWARGDLFFALELLGDAFVVSLCSATAIASIECPNVHRLPRLMAPINVRFFCLIVFCELTSSITMAVSPWKSCFRRMLSKTWSTFHGLSKNACNDRWIHLDTFLHSPNRISFAVQFQSNTNQTDKNRWTNEIQAQPRQHLM